MSLHFILGPAGSGKTRKLFETAIGEAEKNPETTYYFMVPEQFSLQTQYDLLSFHPKGGILNIDVTSMARLANAAFAKLSGMKHEFIPEIGKSMMIKKVLNDNREKFVMYGRNSRQAGFVARAKALLSELWQYGVDEEDIAETLKVSAKEPVLQRKLTDILTLVSGFRTCLGEKRLTNESKYDAFAAVLEKSGQAKNAVFILDGFTGFTPSQNGILSEFLRLGRDVYVSFTCDATALSGVLPEYDVFHMSEEAIKKLTKLAEEVGCEVCRPVFTNHDKYKSQTLKHLEEGLFRHNVRQIPADDSLTVYNAANIEEETRRAAAEAERLIRVKGYRYSDIAIVCGDMDLYGERMCAELDRIKANYFLDRKKTLHENECSGFLEILLKLMEKGADTDLLVAYAKNSLSGIDYDDACILENYCDACGTRGSAFKKEFTREFYGRQDITLEKVNAVRNSLMEELTGMLSVKKKGTTRYFTEKLRSFTERMELRDKLETIAEDFGNKGDRLKAKEYSNVYDALMAILDQAEEFLGEAEMEASEYRGLIEAGLSEAKVGLVPYGSDYITIGDIERTRLSHVKALFLLGANENRLPKPASGGGLISENDKKSLLNKGIELSPSHLKKVGNDKFYIYLTLTKPTEKLWISYPSGNAGERMKPARVLADIAGLYSDFKTIKKSDLDPVTRILENDLGVRTGLDEKRRENARKLGIVRKEPEKIGADEARGLYGNKLTGSISRLETFARCPFGHFLNYGLGIGKNADYKLEINDFGDISHTALELYGKSLKESGKDWVTVTEAEREQLIETCAMNAVDSYKGGVFSDTSKNRYISERIKDALTLTVEMFTKQLQDTDFRPFEFEKKFNIVREDLILNGKIDRIDICDNDDLRAVKIVDYKSGAKTLDLEKIYYGLSLQLPTYLNVATELMNPEIKGLDKADRDERVKRKTEQENCFRPAAMLYDIIQDPITEKDPREVMAYDEKVRAAVEDSVFKEFKTTGLVNDDRDIIKSLDHVFGEHGEELPESMNSKKIPVSTGKKEEGAENEPPKFGKGSAVLPEKKLRMLMEYAVDKMSEGAREIMGGNVSRTPARSDKVDACKYCDYRSVCGFDPKNGDKPNKLKKMKEEELLKEMTGGEN